MPVGRNVDLDRLEYIEGELPLNYEAVDTKTARDYFDSLPKGAGAGVFSATGELLTLYPAEYQNDKERALVLSQVVRFGPDKGKTLQQVEDERFAAIEA